MLIEISEPKNIFNLFCSNIHAMAMVDIIGPSLRSHCLRLNTAAAGSRGARTRVSLIELKYLLHKLDLLLLFSYPRGVRPGGVCAVYCNTNLH